MKISLIGTGYVGLVTGACLAEKGHDITCVDLEPARIARINAGRSPIFEPGLDALIAKHVGHRLRATLDLPAAVRDTDATFIAVGTPFNGSSIDLRDVRRAAQEVGAALRTKPGYHLVVVKSTVIPGTTESLVCPELESAAGCPAGERFGVGVNPEFLSEGTAVRDCLFPDRLVLGASDARALAVLKEIYAPFPHTPAIETNPRTAEMIKYASNALLATLISFANEIANLGTTFGGIDPDAVMRGLHLSQYFRSRNRDGLPPIVDFLRPGCGFGGSCLPKDVRALVAHAQKAGAPAELLRAVLTVNQRQPGQIVSLLERRWPDLHDIPVTVLGLSFKPGTDDVRETPARSVIEQLLAAGAHVTAFDPVAMDNFRLLIDHAHLSYAPDLRSATADAAAIVVVTAWPEFRELASLLPEGAPRPLLVDGRRALTPTQFPDYVGVGD